MGEGCNVDWLTFKEITNGTASAETSLLRLFPLPVKDNLNVETNEENFEITVFNMQGVCIYQNSNQKIIDIKSWQKGMYLFQFLPKSGRKQCLKIIKN